MARLFTIVTVILTLSTVDRSTWAFHACTSEGVGLGCACDSFNTVDCSNRGVKDVPDQVPPDTITLQLNNNKIQGLVENQFPGLSSLLSLDLSNNSISYVEKGAFSALGSLAQLRLNNNKLSSVRTGFPEPTISWETPASPEGARNKEDAGRQMKGTGTLTISDASSEDGGTYGCTTINPGGRDSRLGYLAFFEVPKESPKTSYLGILPSNLAWCLIGAEGHEMLRVCNETQLEDVDDYGNDDDDDNDYEIPHAHASKLTTPFNPGDRLYQSLGKETRPVSGGPPQRRPPPPPPHRHNSHSHPSHQDYTPLVRGTSSARGLNQPESELGQGLNQPESELGQGLNQPESELGQGLNQPESELGQGLNQPESELGQYLDQPESELGQGLNR
ncbi:ASPN [Branchiostoma lanceolatum]|uniref:ASPN protein n=1 Tax=Branchiostoma lanceolatum TaxID=7740 RepID=A0A8J9VLS0_BRALA|nr:ASPN [Branchiostoma lanceolatum]